jgi:hypothetical protein
MIWEKWKKHYRELGLEPAEICKDGVFNNDEWDTVGKKILFIMKEVNDWEGGNLRELFKNGPKYRMWYTVSRWTAGILEGFPTYEYVDKWEVMRKAIRKIASINLKKISGGAYSNMSVINAYAHCDRDLLLEQIEDIKPDIAIACGTFESVIWLLDLEINPDKPHEKPVLDRRRNIWVIPWKHPARVNNEKTYEELKEMMEKIP